VETDPVSLPFLLPLKRWKELVNLFTGGDDEILKAAERMHAENPNNALQVWTPTCTNLTARPFPEFNG
jgi:hypothetical protein